MGINLLYEIILREIKCRKTESMCITITTFTQDTRIKTVAIKVLGFSYKWESSMSSREEIIPGGFFMGF